MDLRFFDLRFAIAFGHLLNFVATTPSSSCVAREGRNPLRPGLWPQADTMARAPSPRKHPRSDDALVVVRCAGGSRLSRPLLAAHHHLPTTTYIFYTSTRPFFTTARAHPSCDRLRGSLRSGDMSPRGGGRDKRDPPAFPKNQSITKWPNAIANRNYQLPSTNYPLHKCNRKS